MIVGGCLEYLTKGEIHSGLVIFFTGEALSALANILTTCGEDNRPQWTSARVMRQAKTPGVFIEAALEQLSFTQQWSWIDQVAVERSLSRHVQGDGDQLCEI